MDEQTVAPDGEEVLPPESVETPAEPEKTDEDLARDVFRKYADEGAAEEPLAEDPEKPDAPARGPDGKFVAKDPAESAAEAPVGQEEVPATIPAKIRAHWSALTPEARQAVTEVQKEYADRMADQGRKL
jgi:hypothetical protein